MVTSGLVILIALCPVALLIWALCVTGSYADDVNYGVLDEHAQQPAITGDR